MRKKWLDRPFGFLLTFLSLIFFVFAIVVIRDVSTILSLTHLTIPDIYSIVTSRGDSLKMENGRTNILLLGSGGGTHEGSDLTDTIIIFSYSHVLKSTSLISVPRDIWSETLKDKINTAYHYGEEKKVGGGYAMARSIITEVTGIPLHYTVSVEFSGFKTVVNTVGGIDVYTGEGFKDPLYPIEGKENDLCNGDPSFACRYTTAVFIKGIEHMDGDRALMYVRSRHADGTEGTDFARSKRQQEVLAALKTKMFDPGFWYSLESVKNVYTSIDMAVNTDMMMREVGILAKLLILTQKTDVEKLNFEDLLIQPLEYLYGGRYVLMPRDGTFREIQSYLQKKLP
ncbi:MAG: LCP family protein [Patescibacteria group bacterium]